MYPCKFTLTNSSVRSSCVNDDKNLTTNLQTLKGEEISLQVPDKYMQSRRKQPHTISHEQA